LDFYTSNRTAQTNDNSFPVTGEAININNCFRQQSLMFRKMSHLLFTCNYDWWDTAVDYVKKRIELTARNIPKNHHNLVIVGTPSSQVSYLIYCLC